MGAFSTEKLTLMDPYRCLYSIALGIREQMKKMKEEGHPFKDVVNLDSVFHFVKALADTGGINAYKDSEGKLAGALGFSVQPVWWTKDKLCLVEEFVLCLSPEYKGFGRVALERLHFLADLFKCDMIMTGNLLGTTPKMTENLYVHKGKFQVQYKHFIKILK